MNSDGQCGVGRTAGDVLEPAKVLLPITKSGEVLVAHMAGGSKHSMLVTAKDSSMGSTSGGKVYVWGCNSDGRLGLGHDRNEWAPVLEPGTWLASDLMLSGGELAERQDLHCGGWGSA